MSGRWKGEKQLQVQQRGRPMPFTEEQMRQIYNTNIIDFAVRNGFEIEKSDKATVHVKHNGGLYLFKHGRGYYSFTEERGGDIVEFAMNYLGLKKREAMEQILGCRAYERTAHVVSPQEKAERGTMVLPPRDTDDRRVFAYLTKTRKIDPEIVQTMMKQAKVYQSRQEIGGKVRRNCAFVGYDSKGTPRYCALRGPSAGSSFRQDMENSDNGLLYIPERMPFPNIRDDRYIQAVMEEILQIVSATHGHTLILFTSYWLMERVFYGLKEQLSDYPLFLMGRGRLDVISSFRRSGNGVLFASDSAGEGIDLAGDILSSLIVVKLPFPVPDPVMEYQRNQYEDFDLYRRDIIIPEMLIKLRQWFGRGIRREKDTAVFSILDSRASLRGRYRAEILNTLPTMPVTDRLMDVADFIIRKKADSYFMDKREEE